MASTEETEPLKTATAAEWTFDDVFKSLGEFGRYQKFLYLLCSLVYTVTSMQLLGWVFVGAVPDHTCNCTQQCNATFIPLRVETSF